MTRGGGGWRYLNSRLEILVARPSLAAQFFRSPPSPIGFEVYKFLEPPPPNFFQSPPFGCLNIFRAPPQYLHPPCHIKWTFPRLHTFRFIFWPYRAPHPPGNSNPFCGGSMDIFWNCTLWLTDHFQTWSFKSRIIQMEAIITFLYLLINVKT